MKMIRIGFFYHDLCNLYGDSGNVMILAQKLEQQGFHVTVDRLTVEEPKKIESYDVIYMGGATERGLLLALMDLRKYKTPLTYAISHGTHILATGNSFELFGKKIIMGRRVYRGLGLLDFSSHYGRRIVNDLFLDGVTFPFGNTGDEMKKFIGFENHSGSTVDSREKLFIDTEKRKEGVVREHFLGTYTVGPLLVRNPDFLKSYVESVIRRKEPSFEMKPMDLHLEEAAYQASVTELSQDHKTY